MHILFLFFTVFSCRFTNAYAESDFDETQPLPGECSSRCYKTMINSKQPPPNFGNITLSRIWDPTEFLEPSLTKEALEGFCTQTYPEFVKCFKTCVRDKMFIDNFEKGLPQFKYICVDNFKNVKSSFDCLKQSVDDSATKACKTLYTAANIISKKPLDRSATLSNQEYSKILDEMCKSTLESGTCFIKYAEESCSRKSSEILAFMYNAKMDKSVNYTLSFLASQTMHLPESCMQVKHMGSSANAFSESVLPFVIAIFVFLCRLF